MFLYYASLFISINHLILGIIVFSLKGANNLVNKLLGLQLFFLFVIHMVGLCTYWPDPSLRYFLGYDFVAGFGYAPVAYLYIRSILGKSIIPDGSLFRHCIITLLVLLIFVGIHCMPETLHTLVYECQHFTGTFFHIADRTMFLHTVTYAVLIYLLYRKEKRKTVKTKAEIQRINTAGFYFLLITLMSLAISLMGLFWNGAILGKYMPFVTFVFFFIIVANSVHASNNILKLDTTPENTAETLTAKDDAEKIKLLIEKQKPYLNKNLTLDELASSLSYSRHQLSFVINNGLGMTFFELINFYRVKESLSIIADPKSATLKIEDIADMSGFNSRAAFYKAFKNQTGRTPTQYRDMQKTT
jgi:AraC-like DNA-binding protein